MTKAEPHRLTRFQKLVTRGFQRYWRMSRGHLLRAEILIWSPDNRLLVLEDGTLPGAPVTRGRSAEEAIRGRLEASPGLSALEPRLVAMALADTGEGASLTTHIAVFEAELAEPLAASPEPRVWAALETLEDRLPPGVLTMLRRRLALRGTGRPV